MPLRTPWRMRWDVNGKTTSKTTTVIWQSSHREVFLEAWTSRWSSLFDTVHCQFTINSLSISVHYYWIARHTRLHANAFYSFLSLVSFSFSAEFVRHDRPLSCMDVVSKKQFCGNKCKGGSWWIAWGKWVCVVGDVTRLTEPTLLSKSQVFTRKWSLPLIIYLDLTFVELQGLSGASTHVSIDVALDFVSVNCVSRIVECEPYGLKWYSKYSSTYIMLGLT